MLGRDLYMVLGEEETEVSKPYRYARKDNQRN